MDGASFATYRPETPSQERALEAMQALAGRLRRHYRWPWRRRPLKGYYLVGPPGTGKTHLLRALEKALTPEVPVQCWHARTFFALREPPETFARAFRRRYRVLLLDELELDDPANDARTTYLFQLLHRQGITLVVTSNVPPDGFLVHRLRETAPQHMLRYFTLLPVEGPDYRLRLAGAGKGWIGPGAHAQLQQAFLQDTRRTCWLPFPALLERARRELLDVLLQELCAFEGLYIPDLAFPDTDTALLWLRIMDALYLAPRRPALYFSSEMPPEQWTAAFNDGSPLAAGIAQKFQRTISRMHALCAIIYERPASLSGDRAH